jgi:hypothetical protein
MANIASQTTVLTNVRATGTKNPAGEQFGGIYYPAHSKNGRTVSARWEGNIALNGKPYTNAAGEKVESKPVYMRLVVWNGKNSAAGKGLADTFAKCVSVGKEISCNVRMESFDKRLFVNGQPMLKQDGSAVTYQAINMVFEDKLIFGDDSGKVVAAEIARWNGQPTFDSRPQFWNIQGHADQQAWATHVVPARMASTWDGQSDRYGYARIIVPEGAIVGNAPVQQAQQVPQVGALPTQAAAVLNTTAVAPAAPVQMAPLTPPAAVLPTNAGAVPFAPAAAGI